MGRKLILEPKKIKVRIEQLKKVYGDDILKNSSNLYRFVFSSIHSYELNLLTKYIKRTKDKDIKIALIKGGERSYSMTYVFLLSQIMRTKNINYWDDLIFIIYYTYYTGFLNDSLSKGDFDYETLDYIVNKRPYQKKLNSKGVEEYETEGMANELFKQSFDFIRRYNFNSSSKSSQKDKVKTLLQNKRRNFVKKFKGSKEVEFFIKHSMKIIRKGL